LGDDEHLAAHLAETKIHLSLFVREDAQTGELARHPTDLLRAVSMPRGKKNHEARSYLAHHRAINRDTRS
jgi:hypothetical protein